jgi:uncharacterized protein (TIGR03083 family)
MNTTVTDVTTMAPFTHREAMAMQAVELDRTLDLLRALGPDDWTAQTDCPDWDVHHMYLHVLGVCDSGASMKENVHQLRAGKRHQKAHGGPLEAGLSAVQVAERADVGPEELVERMTEVAPRTVRQRTKLPSSFMRAITMKVDGPVVEKWRMGYLVDTIYLRDLWMHRVDATRATGGEMVMNAAHDGRLVTDVVAEWARRHGQPFTLTLTGPAGGTFTSRGIDSSSSPGEPAVAVEMDAVEFCRSMAGRAEGEGLLTTIVPF